MSSTRLHKLPDRQTAPSRRGVSSGKSSGGDGYVFAGRLPVANSRAALDPWHERAQFPDRWARWCRENFRSTTQLGAAFGVTEKTARMWWEGATAPQGWAVGYAIKTMPGAAEALLEAA